MSQIGKAFIEITADLKKFPADLRAKLKAALKEGLAGVEFTGLEDKAKVAGEHAAEDLGKGFERKAGTTFKRAGEAGGRSLLGGLRKIFSRNSSEGAGFFSEVGNFFSSALSGIGSAVSAGVGGAIAGGSSALSSVGSSLSSLGSSISPMLVIWATLIPIAIGLAGALGQLSAVLFALPAAAGFAVAAIAPLVIAFQGFGEAVGAGMSGDTAKFDEALKGLAPSARTVVKEFVGLKGQFTAIKQSVQQAFFKPLIGDFTVLGRTLLPVLNTGLSTVARSLGRFVSGLLGILAGKDVLAALNDLFQTTARIVEDMGPTLQNLFHDFLLLIKTGLPFVEKFFSWIARGADSFALWLEKAQKGGKVTAWLERASHIFGQLMGLAGDLGGLVKVIFGNSEIAKDGTDFIDKFRLAVQNLVGYLKSPDGQKTLHNLADLIKWVGEAFNFLVASFPAVLLAFNAVFDAVRWLGRFFESIGRAAVSGVKAIGNFFGAVWDWIKSAGKAIGNFFTKTIPEWFGKLVQWFKDLPGKIGKGLDEGRQSLKDWFVNLLQSWYEGVLFKIGQIIGIFLSLPQLIPAALSALGDVLSSAWTTAWDFAKNAVLTGWANVLAFFMGIPGALSTAGEAIWNWVSDLWTRVSDTATDLVTSGVNKVIDFFTGIPGRIRALGPQILEAAKSIGHKIAEGLTQIGDFASDLGKKVTNALKFGINWVIDSINRGIADVDDKLPGTLPRIPKLARGAVVDSPTLALIGEAGPEVVLPLGNPKRAQELAEQSGLLGMLNRGARTVVNVIAYLDPTGVLIPLTKTVVNDTLNDQGDALPYARTA